MRHWKSIPTFLAVVLSIITWVVILELGYSITTVSYYGGVAYYSGGFSLDAPIGIFTSLACIFLIGSFIHGKPQRMYRGLQAYIVFFGLVLSYVFSDNGRILLWNMPALPNFAEPAVMITLLLTIIAILLLHLVRVPVLHVLAFTSGTKKRQEKMRERPEQPHSYQAGYQAYSPDNRELPTLYKKISGSIAPHINSSEQFEQPQTMYPQLPEMEM